MANTEIHDDSMQLQSSKAFIWPTVSTRITSPYGYRTHPITGVYGFHSGVDIGYRTLSDSVWSAAGGVVVYSDYTNEYGNVVVINSNWQGLVIQTRYAHLKTRSVSNGQSVSQGTPLGIMGETGPSTGVHLHYEVREVNNMSTVWTGSTIDPERFHQIIDSGGGIYSIDNPMSIRTMKDTQVGFSEYDGFSISINDRFLSLDYILSTPVEKLQSLGLTSEDLSLLIENTIWDINSNQMKELLILQKSF